MSDYPTIALTGPGAIGTTIAAVLHEAGRTPLLCGRTAHPELRLRHDEGETVVPGPVLTDPSVITRPVDRVFLAVKTTQNADSAGWLRALCDENTVVCALQNGVEQKAQLAPLVNGATVLPSVVWFPAQREPDASVWLRAKPRLTLPDVPQAQRVVEALRGTRCDVELSTDFTTVAPAQAAAKRGRRADGAGQSPRRDVQARGYQRAGAGLPARGAYRLPRRRGEAGRCGGGGDPRRTSNARPWI